MHWRQWEWDVREAGRAPQRSVVGPRRAREPLAQEDRGPERDVRHQPAGSVHQHNKVHRVDSDQHQANIKTGRDLQNIPRQVQNYSPERTSALWNCFGRFEKSYHRN